MTSSKAIRQSTDRDENGLTTQKDTRINVTSGGRYLPVPFFSFMPAFAAEDCRVIWVSERQYARMAEPHSKTTIAGAHAFGYLPTPLPTHDR